MKKSKDKLWTYLQRYNFPSVIEGYRSYSIRLQKQKQTAEILVSLSSGSGFIYFPIEDLPHIIMTLMKIEVNRKEGYTQINVDNNG